MEESGRILQRNQVPTSLPGRRHVLEHYEEPMKAVLEASRNWGPIYDWLDELTDEVVLAHPAKVRAIADARIKTDKIDSATLAHLLRTDLIPHAYAPSRDIRAVKRVLRQRMFLVRVQTMIKNRIHALLGQHPVDVPKMSDLFVKAGGAVNVEEFSYASGKISGWGFDAGQRRLELTRQFLREQGVGRSVTITKDQPQGLPRLYLIAWLVLIAITVLEASLILVFRVPPAVRATTLIVLALMKASLIGGYYMNLRFERLALVYVAAVPLTLFILMLLSVLPEAARLLRH